MRLCVCVCVCVCVCARVFPSGENTLTLPRHLSESPVTAVTHPRWKEKKKKQITRYCVVLFTNTQARTNAHTQFHIYQPHEMSYSDETLRRLKMLNSHLIKRVYTFAPSREGKARFDKSDMRVDRERWELNLSLQEKKKTTFQSNGVKATEESVKKLTLDYSLFLCLEENGKACVLLCYQFNGFFLFHSNYSVPLLWIITLLSISLRKNLFKKECTKPVCTPKHAQKPLDAYKCVDKDNLSLKICTNCNPQLLQRTKPSTVAL